MDVKLDGSRMSEISSGIFQGARRCVACDEPLTYRKRSDGTMACCHKCSGKTGVRVAREPSLASRLSIGFLMLRGTNA